MKLLRRAIVIVAIVVLALSTAQASQAAVPPAGDDLFGLYAFDNFNGDPSDDNPNFVDGLGLMTVYIYLTHVTARTIGGYEFALSYEPQAIAPVMVDVALPPAGVDSGEENEFIVVFGSPFLPDEYGHAILATLQYLVSVTEEVLVRVGPVLVPTVPDQIVYIEFDDPALIHTMNTLSGSFETPIFSFNLQVPVADTAWSGVKALYR